MIRTLTILFLVLFSFTTLAGVTTNPANELLNNFDLKDQILNEVYYGYLGYDGASTTEEWEEMIGDTIFTITEKTKSTYPEGTKGFEEGRTMTTKMSLVVNYDGVDCDVILTKVFGGKQWKVSGQGGIYIKTTPDSWKVDVLNCVDLH